MLSGLFSVHLASDSELPVSSTAGIWQGADNLPGFFFLDARDYTVPPSEVERPVL